jgi:cytochrome c biogenesis protein CcmG/thiol:disulfide interchange protein DsbE
MQTRLLAVGLAGLVLLGISAWKIAKGPAEAGRTANLNFTLKDAQGHDVRLADFRGKPLIINFWATWCGPCKLETPELVELAAEYRSQGLNIVGISIDDTAEQIQAFAKAFEVTYPLLIGRDRDDVATAFELGDGIPTSILIRPDGTIAARLEGINTKEWFEFQIRGLFN